MADYDNRSGGNKFLFLLFTLLVLIVPAGLMIWATTKYVPHPDMDAIHGTMRILLIFLVFPSSIVYFFVSLNSIFPRRNTKALLLFLPYAINFSIYILAHGVRSGIVTIWLYQMIPLFLGYVTALMIGLGILIYSGVRSKRNSSLESLVFCIITFFIYILPILYLYVMGVRIAQTIESNLSASVSTLLFFASVVMVIKYHFPILTGLYRKGKL